MRWRRDRTETRAAERTREGLVFALDRLAGHVRRDREWLVSWQAVEDIVERDLKRGHLRPDEVSSALQALQGQPKGPYRDPRRSDLGALVKACVERHGAASVLSIPTQWCAGAVGAGALSGDGAVGEVARTLITDGYDGSVGELLELATLLAGVGPERDDVTMRR